MHLQASFSKEHLLLAELGPGRPSTLLLSSNLVRGILTGVDESLLKG